MATLHSLSVLDTLYRLETMLGAATSSAFARTPRDMIARFVDLVVYMEYGEVTRERWIGDAQQVVGVEGRCCFLARRRRYHRATVGRATRGDAPLLRSHVRLTRANPTHEHRLQVG